MKSPKITPIRVREHTPLDGKIKRDVINSCEERFVKNSDDGAKSLFHRTKKGITTRNYVGILPIDKNSILEIYPKLSLKSGETEDISPEEKTVFFRMLRHWRGSKLASFNETKIDKLKSFTLWEFFVEVFLQHTLTLVNRGMIRRYESRTDNLPYLKGRLQFPQHAIINSANKARFYTQYDEFTPDNAANRLIRKTLDVVHCRQAKSNRLRRQLIARFDDIPASVNIDGDLRQYERYSVGRAMKHYATVMRWVELLLRQYGLTTYQGATDAPSLLFPMEQIFEHFVTYHIRQAAGDSYDVTAQGPQHKMAQTGGQRAEKMFQMKPDIHLQKKSGGAAIHILDAKWKMLDGGKAGDKYNISQGDMYQLYTYGKLYGCGSVMMIYPKNHNFTDDICLQFIKKSGGETLRLICHPFDLEDPEGSARSILAALNAAPAG